MYKIWLITDTHFNDNKLVEFGIRPENQNEIIIENWNKLVKHNDIVLHLGDVIVGKPNKLGDIMWKLNGIKWLVLGNHDFQSIKFYMKNGFSFVGRYVVIGNAVFSHKPLRSLPPGCNINYHGHLHDSEEREVVERSWHKLIKIEDTLSPVKVSIGIQPI